jgi:hypothetical protein
MAKKKRSTHSLSQARYYSKKLKTHKRIRIWVPKHKAEAFLKSVDKLLQKF